MNKPPIKLFSFLDMLGRAAPRLDVVDVGAMWMGEENCAYRPLLRHAHVVGFEPVPEECAKLNKLGLRNHTYLPYFIGDGGEGTFYLTAAPMCSSLYEPNMRLLSRFYEVDELTRPVATSRVQTKRLDDIPEIGGVDFLKVDVQGGELGVIKGAERLLRTALVVQTEVEFIEMYIGQPLFAEVDQEMRRQGYVLHIMGHACGRPMKPIAPGGRADQMVNQAMWTDAVYVKDFMRLKELSQEQLVKMAVILHELYGSVDLAALCLQHHDAKVNKGLWKAYMTRLTGNAAEPPPLE
jgi:protein O-GlcNAc transferase